MKLHQLMKKKEADGIMSQPEDCHDPQIVASVSCLSEVEELNDSTTNSQEVIEPGSSSVEVNLSAASAKSTARFTRGPSDIPRDPNEGHKGVSKRPNEFKLKRQ